MKTCFVVVVSVVEVGYNVEREPRYDTRGLNDDEPPRAHRLRHGVGHSFAHRELIATTNE